MHAKDIGWLFLAVVISGYTYWTVWLLLTPFIPSGHPFQKLFPPAPFAYILPIGAGTLLFASVVTNIGSLLLKEWRGLPVPRLVTGQEAPTCLPQTKKTQ